MIVTNVDNFYVTDDKIINSPSRERGVSEEDEFAMRVHGCELIQEAAVLLVVVNTEVAMEIVIQILNRTLMDILKIVKSGQ